MAGMSHEGKSAGKGTTPMAGMSHEGKSAGKGTTPMAGMSHEGMQPGKNPVHRSPALATLRNGPAAGQSGEPAATLRPDPLDRAAETSVRDASRSAEMSVGMSGEMGEGAGMQHGMSSYRQLDAGRDSVTTGQEEGSVAPRSPTSPDHGGMQHGSPPAAPPRAPATTKPPASKPTPSKSSPEPTHPPHRSGGHEDGSRHGEERL